jgi:hypothetical protein
VIRDALAGLRARRGRTLLAALGVLAAALVVGTATTVGFSLATGFDRAADRAGLPDIIARFDRRRGVAHAVQRQQPHPHDDEREAADEREHARDDDPLDQQEPLERLVGGRHRDGGDDRRAVGARTREHPVVARRGAHRARGAGGDLPGQLRLGARLVAAEEGVVGHGARAVALLAERVRRRTPARWRPAAPVAEAAGVQEPALELPLQRGHRVLELGVDPVEQEGALGGVGDGAHEQHPGRGEHEHARHEPPAQRRDHARGVRRV